MLQKVFGVLSQEYPERAGLHIPAVIPIQGAHGLGADFQGYQLGFPGLEGDTSEGRQGMLRLEGGADHITQIQLGDGGS